MAEITDPSVQWGLQKGKETLAANLGTNKGQIAKYLQQYGYGEPGLLPTLYGNMDTSTRRAQERLEAGAGESQLRANLSREYLQRLQDQFAQQQKANKYAVWGQALGGAAQLGQGLFGMLFKPKPPIPQPILDLGLSSTDAASGLWSGVSGLWK